MKLYWMYDRGLTRASPGLFNRDRSDGLADGLVTQEIAPSVHPSSMPDPREVYRAVQELSNSTETHRNPQTYSYRRARMTESMRCSSCADEECYELCYVERYDDDLISDSSAI